MNFKYLSYVVRHKWFVLVAGIKIGAPFWRLLTHDLSKFLPSEWRPYAYYFYGGPHTAAADFPQFAKYEFGGWVAKWCAEAVRQRFDRAWLRHQHRNPHHWQYWILREDSGGEKLQPMPRAYMLEMVADWMGAGRAITGKWEAAEWYLKNADKIQLNADTRSQVEAVLGIGEGVADA